MPIRNLCVPVNLVTPMFGNARMDFDMTGTGLEMLGSASDFICMLLELFSMCLKRFWDMGDMGSNLVGNAPRCLESTIMCHHVKDFE
jgi:hypothetical protein